MHQLQACTSCRWFPVHPIYHQVSFLWIILPEQSLQWHKNKEHPRAEALKKSNLQHTRQGRGFPFFMLCHSHSTAQSLLPNSSSLHTARDTVIKHRTSHSINQPQPSLLVYSSRIQSYYQKRIQKPMELETRFFSKAEISPVGQEVSVQQFGSAPLLKQA